MYQPSSNSIAYDGLGRNAHPESTRQEARQLAESGLAYTEISRRIGVHRKTLLKWFGRSHLFTDYPDATKHRAFELRRDGLSLGQISYRLGVPKSTVGDWLRGVEPGYAGPR